MFLIIIILIIYLTSAIVVHQYSIIFTTKEGDSVKIKFNNAEEHNNDNGKLIAFTYNPWLTIFPNAFILKFYIVRFFICFLMRKQYCFNYTFYNIHDVYLLK